MSKIGVIAAKAKMGDAAAALSGR
ncbi:MAG: hypothetical protein C207_03018, partial [Bradyrhizobium sp. DFCI-1]